MSAQLSRRSVDIHFRRYHADLKEDVQAFKSVVLTFQRHMPLEEPPDLVDCWEYCYERTLGCVGILKDWLTRALRDALEEGATTVTLKHLQRRAWSVTQCRRMLKEIQEGEKQLSETENDCAQLRAALGLAKQPSLRQRFSGSEVSSPTQEEAPKTTGRKGSVGKRKPKRDRIGVEQDAS